MITLKADRVIQTPENRCCFHLQRKKDKLEVVFYECKSRKKISGGS